MSPVPHDPLRVEDCDAGGEALALLEGAARTYRSGAVAVEALQPVNLCVRRGDFLAVMGPSGSGKSTLLHVLGCLDRPTAGRYLLDGRDVSALADRELAAVRNATIGFVFQRFHLLADESAVRNVALPLLYAGVGRVERARRAAEALESVGLGPRMAHRPNQMSGGEQQRVALARALVKRPRLLLADEPTGNLDTVSGERVLSLIQAENAQGTAVIMITHDPEVAARAETTLLMRDGRLMAGPRPV
ncbi:MAG: ABC transporter ATP-binding protein [Planctomycetota bacterium]|nr:ABC transporter ATP-binding protein [Planctomycetota bacterium]